jgi:hypothetical protein
MIFSTKKIQKFLKDYTWQSTVVLFAIAFLLSLLWFRLGSLTFGNAANIEAATKLSASSWQAVIENPLNLPYKIVHRIVQYLGHDGITSLRLISTVFGALAAVLFYQVARQWHSGRVAFLSSWLFVTSSWFLHTARLGSAEILWLTSILAIVVLLTPSRSDRHSTYKLPIMLTALTLVLYVPGMVWLVLGAILLQRKNIVEAWRATRWIWLKLLSIFASLVLLLPLVYGLVRSPKLTLYWLGLTNEPGGSIPAVNTILLNLLEVPKSLVYSGSFDAAHWLGELPLLSAFEIIMLILGIYFYSSHVRAARTRLIMVLAALGWLLAGMMGATAISLVVPVIYLLVASGIAYILHMWLKVFPNNPIARAVGIAVILFTVILTSVYQTRSYYVAWRYSDDTAKTFTIKL